MMLAEKDFYSDPDILLDPYAFFEEIREYGPIHRPDGRDYLIVTGFKEAIDIFLNKDGFSSSIALQGAGCPLSFTPDGPDIRAQLDDHRSEILGHDLLVDLDGTAHSNLRALVNRLFTPSRLRANERFIDTYSHQMVADAVAKGGCDLISDIATPFVTMVIADLLGVPIEDRQIFMDAIAAAPVAGSLNEAENDFSAEDHPMVVMGQYFARYILDRQQNPTDDILTELAHATYPDGSKPKLEDLVNLSTFMFGAGQDTSAKLIGNAMRYIVDVPGLQAKLRADPALIPAMLEEVLRLEGSSKATARLCLRDTTIGGYKIKAGTKVLIALAAISRDPQRWDEPNTFVMGRPRIKEHLSFGRGAHTCAGAPLARVEVRILIEKFLEQTSDINLLEERHGTPGERRLDFEPSFIVRGLSELHLNLEPTSA